ncbi:MAG: response regulator [candidate division Zixibacteria bacterium]|nr:response regulator [candidate division Zixibacteria bacterium]
MKILVADDDPIIRKLLSEVLTSDGHQVTVTENGLQALKEAQKQSFQLVFMDVHMPVMNGLETLISIRSLHPEVVVAMMDSYPDQLVRQAESKGAMTCIHKPFDLNEVRKVIEEAESTIHKERSVKC